jgi:predicted Zn-dependent protease with MMP-like domain
MAEKNIGPLRRAMAKATAQVGYDLIRQFTSVKLLVLNQNEIREEVVRVLDQLPKQFREHLSNLEIVVEERPDEEILLAEELDPRYDTLYGLYQGVPLPDRSAFYPPILPDKITIFSEPLLRDFPDPADLREQIRLTVLHEIAHFFGMDEDDIDKLGY